MGIAAGAVRWPQTKKPTRGGLMYQMGKGAKAAAPCVARTSAMADILKRS